MSLYPAILEAAWFATQPSTRTKTNEAEKSMSGRIDQEAEWATVGTACQDVCHEYTFRTIDLVSDGVDLAISTG